MPASPNTADGHTLETCIRRGKTFAHADDPIIKIISIHIDAAHPDSASHFTCSAGVPEGFTASPTTQSASAGESFGASASASVKAAFGLDSGGF
jgi:hypothetical protein